MFYMVTYSLIDVNMCRNVIALPYMGSLCDFKHPAGEVVRDRFQEFGISADIFLVIMHMHPADHAPSYVTKVLVR